MLGSFAEESFSKIEWPWIKFGFQVQYIEQYRCTLSDGYRRDNAFYGKVDYNYIVTILDIPKYTLV